MRKITSFFKKVSKKKEEGDVCIGTSQCSTLEDGTVKLEDDVTFENDKNDKENVMIIILKIKVMKMIIILWI